MTETGVLPEHAREGHRQLAERRLSERRLILCTAGAALLVVVIYGGYGNHWPWTGINEHTASLWEWLNLLLLPVVVAVVPIWVRRRKQLRPGQRAVGLALLAVFSLVVVLGYVVPWAWTGFVGNTLWDWLKLLALPIAVALIPVVGILKAGWDRRHWQVLLAGLVVFMIPVLGGYLGDWRWTGFHGNTFWDWLHLLLLPLLIPTIVVPALTLLATEGVQPPAHRRLRAEGKRRSPAEQEGALAAAEVPPEAGGTDLAQS